MVKSLNKVQLIGNVGKDPEIRFSGDGKPIANFSIATSDSYTGKDGNKVEKTEWHKIVAFGKLAEIISKYVKKGSKVYIEGQLQTRKWTDNNGQDRYSTEIILTPFNGQLLMLDGHSGGSDGGQQKSQPQGQGRTQTASQAQPPTSGPNDEYSNAPPDFDDDIPF